MEGNWFHEKHHTFPGQTFGLEVEKVLHHRKSEYQDVLIFKSKTYGNVMVLDGIINSTSRDECAYQEMISFLPLNSHPHPKKVLIIGGGDGGVARECAKHPLVESVTMVEIDKDVVDASKQCLPDLAVGMAHPKVTVLVEDGLAFLQNNSTTYDVVIADLSDPDGPAEQLFQQTFYQQAKERMNPGGILCTQGESIWLDLDLIESMINFCKKIFPSVSYAFNGVPTYTSGSIGYIICGMDEVYLKNTVSDCVSNVKPFTAFTDVGLFNIAVQYIDCFNTPAVSKQDKTLGKDFTKPLHVFTDEEKDGMQLKYYNEGLHHAAFALPQFVRKLPDQCPLCFQTLSGCALLVPPFCLPCPFHFHLSTLVASESSYQNQRLIKSCSVVVKPTDGDFLSSYSDGDDLHVGLTDSNGDVFSFCEDGVLKESSGWDSCLCLPIIPSDQMNQELVQSWDLKLNLTRTDSTWSKSRYHVSDFNCYNYVVSFMSDFLDVPITKSVFCGKHLVPVTTRAAKYLSLCKDIETRRVVVHDAST